MKKSLLTKENIEFANHVAWKFGRAMLSDQHEKSITMEDLQQESFLGLWEAAQRYDAALGIDFRSLAFVWCRKFVIRALHKYGTPLTVPERLEETVALLHLDAMSCAMKDPGTEDDEDDVQVVDEVLWEMIADDEAEKAADEDQQERIERALNGLSPKERKALVCLFGLGSQTEPQGREATAQQLGIAPGRVTQIKERALRKLELLLSA